MPDPSAYEWRAFSECNMCGASLAAARALGRRCGEHQGLRPARRPVGAFATVQRCAGLRLGVRQSDADPARHRTATTGFPPEEYWEHGDLSPSEDYFADQILQFRRLYPRSGRPHRA